MASPPPARYLMAFKYCGTSGAHSSVAAVTRRMVPSSASVEVFSPSHSLQRCVTVRLAGARGSFIFRTVIRALLLRNRGYDAIGTPTDRERAVRAASGSKRMGDPNPELATGQSLRSRSMVV